MRAEVTQVGRDPVQRYSGCRWLLCMHVVVMSLDGSPPYSHMWLPLRLPAELYLALLVLSAWGCSVPVCSTAVSITTTTTTTALHILILITCCSWPVCAPPPAGLTPLNAEDAEASGASSPDQGGRQASTDEFELTDDR
jgi:hypothetical protein